MVIIKNPFQERSVGASSDSLNKKTMNLLSDLSNELALAILVDKKHSEKVGLNEAANLIGKVREVLQPVSIDQKDRKPIFLTAKDSKAASH